MRREDRGIDHAGSIDASPGAITERGGDEVLGCL